MPWRARKSLQKALEPSRRAAAADGPKQGIPASPRRSATPSVSGSSGPTTTKDTPRRCASATTSSTFFGFSDGRFSTLPPIPAVPPFPGPTQTLSTCGDSASLTAIACSRPPDPNTRTATGLDSFSARMASWAAKTRRAAAASSPHRLRGTRGPEALLPTSATCSVSHATSSAATTTTVGGVADARTNAPEHALTTECTTEAVVLVLESRPATTTT
mmetsp:Transcript_14948/g.44298  ORF Transcript_14948/g.44298 Transcript_14948/m.44298 type:complete len:216 (+) Transcript_14948:2604-3251(+)